jgi:pimeloyl-ACP methyl ester carboxylesterase
MPPRRRFGKRIVRSLLPIVLVVALAILASLAYVIFGITRPPRRAYLVTPDAFKQFSGPVVKVTDESWSNADGSKARGWLLKGAEGAPAVMLLHRYGSDRSWLFNLGVKINETTSFTILWPDLRGHGVKPLVGWTSFGGREGQDLLSALNFLRNLKSDSRTKLVADRFGVFGVELGAYAALKAANSDNQISALALDSVPGSPDALVRAAIASDTGIDNRLLDSVSLAALKIYLLGAYENKSSCELASSLADKRVLLLSGSDAGNLRYSTADLAQCFPNHANVEVRTDLPLSGFNLPLATGEQGEGYDRIVIDFFDRTLR